ADDIKTRGKEVCRTADEFTKLYYDALKKKKAGLQRLYMDNGTLIYNGNCISGSENISKFLNRLPEPKVTLENFDAQPVHDEVVAGQKTILLTCAGNIRFGDDGVDRSFNQAFLITAVDDKWKIVSDDFRIQEPLVSIS
ncbi:unnamed protein product, partial [Cyprideis torosa]